MKKYTNNEIKYFCDAHKVLRDRFYSNFIYVIRTKIPSDINISDIEIESELNSQGMYLSSIFNGGDFIGYFARYAVKRVVDAIWSEYNKIDHTELQDAINEYEDGYDYNEYKQYIRYEMDRAKSNESKKQDQLLVNDIFDIVTGIDKIICNLVMDGKSNREIAKIVGLDDKTIGNRLHKIARIIKGK